MGKITILITILLFLNPTYNIVAQTEEGIINGRVIDSKLGEPPCVC